MRLESGKKALLNRKIHIKVNKTVTKVPVLFMVFLWRIYPSHVIISTRSDEDDFVKSK